MACGHHDHDHDHHSHDGHGESHGAGDSSAEASQAQLDACEAAESPERADSVSTSATPEAALEDSLLELSKAYTVTLSEGAGWVAVTQEQHTGMRAFTLPEGALRTVQMPDGSAMDLAAPAAVCDTTLSSYAWHVHVGGTFRYELVGDGPVWVYFATDSVGHAPASEDEHAEGEHPEDESADDENTEG